MKMSAVVLEVERCSLLVCDHCTHQKVVVHTPDACCFCVGDWICICYDGMMTRSIPPQITAECIWRIPKRRCCR